MKQSFRNVVVCAVMTVMPLAALAGEPTIGEGIYTVNCAVCHGTTGAGDGSFAGMLTVKPSNLTVLSKNNGGVFPVDRLHKVIDGRDASAGHGSSTMPIWGDRFSTNAAAYYADTFASHDPEVFVRGRILALISYLDTLQKK